MIPNREVIFTVKRANSRILLHLKPKAAPINRRPFFLCQGKPGVPSGQTLTISSEWTNINGRTLVTTDGNERQED